MGGRLSVLALSLLPYAGLGSLIQFCRKTKALDLNDTLEITPLMRKALLVHFWYFIAIPLNIEVFPDVPGIEILVGSMEKITNGVATTNGFHMLQCLAAENFFVTSAALGFILMQSSVPRWTLMTPFAQLAWNLKNHLSWFFIPIAPEGRMPFALADISLIWPITAVYLHFFFNANKIEKKRE
jgi:hypothetical protein